MPRRNREGDLLKGLAAGVVGRRRKRRFRDTQITLAHGSGGRAMHELIEGLFLEYLRNPLLEKLEEQAVFEIGLTDGGTTGLGNFAQPKARVAFTTDSYVVDPISSPAVTSANSPFMGP